MHRICPTVPPEFRLLFPQLTGVLTLAFFIHNCVITLLKSNKHQENNVSLPPVVLQSFPHCDHIPLHWYGRCCVQITLFNHTGCLRGLYQWCWRWLHGHLRTIRQHSSFIDPELRVTVCLFSGAGPVHGLRPGGVDLSVRGSDDLRCLSFTSSLQRMHWTSKTLFCHINGILNTIVFLKCPTFGRSESAPIYPINYLELQLQHIQLPTYVYLPTSTHLHLPAPPPPSFVYICVSDV